MTHHSTHRNVLLRIYKTESKINSKNSEKQEGWRMMRIIMVFGLTSLPHGGSRGEAGLEF